MSRPPRAQCSPSRAGLGGLHHSTIRWARVLAQLVLALALLGTYACGEEGGSASAGQDSGLSATDLGPPPCPAEGPRPDGGSCAEGWGEGDFLPVLQLSDCEGRVWSSEQAPAPPARLLSLHAGWCGPCRDQEPSLEALVQRLGPQGLEVLVVLGEDAQAGAGTVSESYCLGLQGQLDPELLILRDPGFAATGGLVQQRLPVLVLVDAYGRIRSLGAGWDPSWAPAWEERVRALLESVELD